MQRINIFFLIIFYTVLTLPVMAQEAVNPYTVSDIEASATGSNATEARLAAMQNVNKAAFAKLLENLGQNPAMADAVKPDQIEGAIEGFQILSEQMSSKSYTVKMAVTFIPDAANSLIQQAASAQLQAAPASVLADRPSASPALAQPVLILPLLHDYGRTMLWEESNGWRSLWSSKGASQPGIILPLGDLTDVSSVDIGRVEKRDPSLLRQLATRYHAGVIIVADASERAQPQGLKLDVSLQPVFMENPDSSHFMAESFSIQGSSEQELFSRAVDESLRRIAGQGKNTAANTQPYDGPAQQVKLVVPLQRIDEWVRVRQILENTPQINSVQLLAISATQADVMIRFNCDMAQMAATLSRSGGSLQQQQGYWILRPAL